MSHELHARYICGGIRACVGWVALQIELQLRVSNGQRDGNSVKSSKELVLETSAPQWAGVLEA